MKQRTVKPAIQGPPGCTCKLEAVPHPTKPGRVVAYCKCGSAWQGRAVYEGNAVEPVKEENDNGST